MLRAREALVAARTELINATPGLVKSMGTRLPKCSSPSFGRKVKDAISEKVREALQPDPGSYELKTRKSIDRQRVCRP